MSERTAVTTYENCMGRDVARADAPVEGSIRQEVEKFAARHIILGIHDVEVLVDRIHDNAVRQAYLAHLWRGAQMVSHLLMSPHVYYTITYGVSLIDVSISSPMAA